MQMIMIYTAGIINDHELCHVTKLIIQYSYSSCFDFEVIISYQPIEDQNITQSTFQLIYLANIFSIFILSSQTNPGKTTKGVLTTEYYFTCNTYEQKSIYSSMTIHLLFIQAIFLLHVTMITFL